MNSFFIRRQCSIASKIPNPKVAQQKHKISEFRRARIKSQIVLDSSGDVLSRKNMEKSRYQNEHLFLGCPAGFGDIGVGEPSRHDSIDNTE